jgi:transcription antitermination protein NusB
MGNPPPALEPGGKAGRGHRRRRSARRMAIDILYQADVREQPPATVLEEWRRAGRKIPAYAEEIVRGVERDQTRIDRELGANSEEWTVQRMAMVDRTILRVACQELRAGLPPAIAINEAVEAANELSTEDSGRFINGVLGRIARDLGTGG